MNSYLKALGLAVALIAAPTASAGEYSAMYVFGDSLSDRGNLAEAFGARWIDPPSFHYSFTDGPVAVSVLASKLDLKADPSLWLNNFNDDAGLFPAGYAPGTNYAVADATASAGGGIGAINLPFQVDAYLDRSSGVADGDALYTVFIGGNDVANATRSGTGAIALTTAVSSEISSIQSLLNAGAKNIFVVNVPDVGATPAFLAGGMALSELATANSRTYNGLLASELGKLTGSGASIRQFDLFGYSKQIISNASSYGITNTVGYCYDIGLPPTDPAGVKTTEACGEKAENIGQLAYWNNFHPTGKVHNLIGQGMFDVLAGSTAVPEPATWMMMIVGFGLMGLCLRRPRDGRQRLPGGLRPSLV
ncbi:SGNH/GDSL hydrolase family protein [Sphingomonas sp. BK580]|uniref:SGNH/GDSL hydrolase family protein n=1 Tax=Sphingomonas sp. BK580 TaxID=2586972 RepID=UPI00160F6717|nr:SGNH/GDSL hydrolase family protein [Sphingomonas sp. BK580]MBB3694917.1 outer membrane lipase/esterase [Sphingomonas sp. BK580]